MSTVDLDDAYERARSRLPGLAVSLARIAESTAALDLEPAHLEARGDELVLAHAASLADPTALSAFEHEAIEPARGVIRRYLQDPARADEVVQQLRIHLLVAEPPAPPRLARFDARAALRSWVNMCAARLALHALRGERRREIEVEWSEALAGLPAADPVVDELRARNAELVAEALRDACIGLSRRHRAILRLLFLQGASVDEAAAMYQVHRVTVWRWVQEARAELSTATRARLTALGTESDVGTATLIAWVHDQVELSLDGVLAPTLTAPPRAQL